MLAELLILAQQDPVETTITWPELAGGVAALLTIVGLLGAGLAWYIRTVMHRESQPVRDQLATTNGHTAGQLIEATAGKVDELEAVASANRSRLDMHEARIDAHDVRLDRHIVAGHKEGAS